MKKQSLYIIYKNIKGQELTQNVEDANSVG